MAKIAIKYDNIVPYGVFFYAMNEFMRIGLDKLADWRFDLHCELWLSVQRNHPLDFIRPFLAMTMPEQAHHCSSGLTKPFAYERLFLWRLMHRGCHHSSDVPSLASSDTSHMQCRHDSQSHKGTYPE